MAIKRVFNKYNDRARRCLECGVKIGPRILRDNKPYTCTNCGQVHLVDIHDGLVSLTKEEKKEYRRRHTDIKEDTLKVFAEEIDKLKKEAREWKEIAEGLASYIEEIKSKEKINNENIGTI